MGELEDVARGDGLPFPVRRVPIAGDQHAPMAVGEPQHQAGEVSLLGHLDAQALLHFIAPVEGVEHLFLPVNDLRPGIVDRHGQSVGQGLFPGLDGLHRRAPFLGRLTELLEDVQHLSKAVGRLFGGDKGSRDEASVLRGYRQHLEPVHPDGPHDPGSPAHMVDMGVGQDHPIEMGHVPVQQILQGVLAQGPLPGFHIGPAGIHQHGVVRPLLAKLPDQYCVTVANVAKEHFQHGT